MTLTDEQHAELAAICQKLNALLVIAYGSKVSGVAHVESDFDIAILFGEPPTYEHFKEIYTTFSGIFPAETVDVRFLNDADPLYSLQVVRDGVLLFGNQNDFDTLKMMTNRRYVDDGKKYFPLRDELLKRLNHQLTRAL